MNKIYYVRHDGNLTLYRNGKMAAVANDHPNFSKILAALRARQYDTAVELMESVAQRINRTGAAKSRKLAGRRVFVKDGKVFWLDSHNREVELGDSNPLVRRVVEALGGGDERYADALLRFLDNLKKNTLKDIRDELFAFLENGKMPITEDGCFLAYKMVRDDYKDKHTGTFDNSPGTVVSMLQDDVDRDRTNTCSTGLHFGARGYMNQFGDPGDRCLIVKVNPRHVFAIPNDYNNMKGRTSQYYVIGEFQGYDGRADPTVNEAFKAAFVNNKNLQASCPDVKFAGWLRPSLEKIGASYGLVTNGKVTLIERRGVDVAVKPRLGGTKSTWVDVRGVEVVGEPRNLSVETKSAREALKRAIAFLER